MNDAWREIAAQAETSHQQFVHGCRHLRDSQNEILVTLLHRNRHTEFGQRYSFADIIDAEDLLKSFQTHVPIQTYESIEAGIVAQMAGSKSLLEEPVQFYEPTGGSSGGSKTIPYTQSTMQLLQAAIEPWLFELVSSRPAIAHGPSYWSVSPAIRAEAYTEDGTRIGADSDIEFMREDLQAAFFATMVNPNAIVQADSYLQWQRLTLLTLIMNEDLRLISIWSPSFLTTLLGSLTKHSGWLYNALKHPADAGLEDIEWLGDNTQNQKAIERLEKSSSAVGAESSVVTSCLWPNLDTISCWTHGPAAGPANELKRWFPDVYFQPKGLLATEGVITVPFTKSVYPVLAVNSGFFEFVDDENRVVLPENLQIGHDYQVLITNASGLYRYDIGDQVRMRGIYNQAAMLEFIGRTNNTSDLAGEKLEESFVNTCLNHSAGFNMLAPRGNNYCLYVEQFSDTGQAEGYSNYAAEVDSKLCENPQYRYARELGQLAPVQLCPVPELARHHIEWQQEKGQSIGDIKPIALCTDSAFIEYLDKLSQ